MAKEIEKKFLVMKPDTLTLARNYQNIQVKYIEQTYLLAKSGERRLRRVTTEIIGEFDYICKFFYTEKHPLSQDGLVREENEVSITYREYLKLMQEADSTLHKINKTRYTFYIDEQAYELDIYDFDTNYAILEIEMPTENTPYKWPDSLVLVKDVTSDKRFKNRSISETLQFPVI